MKPLRHALLIAGGVAAPFACLVLWVALSHNPQQEFYGSEFGVNWEGIAVLWCASFTLVFVVIASLLWAIRIIGERKKKRRAPCKQ